MSEKMELCPVCKQAARIDEPDPRGGVSGWNCTWWCGCGTPSCAPNAWFKGVTRAAAINAWNRYAKKGQGR